MRSKIDQDPQDEALEALFDATAPEPSSELLGRMMARAAEVPRSPAAVPWWRRLLLPMGWLPAAGMAGLAAALLAGVWLAGSPVPRPSQVADNVASGVGPDVNRHGARNVPTLAVPATTSREPGASSLEPADSDGLVELDDGDLFDGLDPEGDSDELLSDLEPPHVDYQGVADRVWIQVYDALLARND